jgi:hemolysin D
MSTDLPAVLPPMPSAALAPSSRLPLGLRARLADFADNRENQAFLPAHLEILETPPSPLAVVFVWVICGLFAATILWSCLATIDIYAVASGRVQADGGSKVVQSLGTGRVQAILTENGAHVMAGTLLIELDATSAMADMADKQSSLAAREAQVARFRGTIEAVQANKTSAELTLPGDIAPAIRTQQNAAMQADIDQYASTRAALLAQLEEKVAAQQRYTKTIAGRERLQSVLKERAMMKDALLARAAGTRTALLDAMQQVEQASVDLAYDQGQLVEAEAAATSLQRRLEQSKSETLAKNAQSLAESIERRAAATQDLVKARYQLAQMQLSSPIEGTVQQLAVRSAGQVVSPGQPLLVVVPSHGAINVEALIQNKDVGFVKTGQDAVIKIDAFPFTRYGTVEGRVARISHDAIDMRDAGGATDAVSVARGQSIAAAAGAPATQNLVFPTMIRMERNAIMSGGREVPLTPGMTVSVEIRTGERRVIDYLLAPIRETSSTAGHER